jgi:hypothetical protein
VRLSHDLVPIFWGRLFSQEERIKTYKLFKEGNKRILVATDLVGRGIDIERVNIVINYDMPETDDKKGNGADTYLHRVSGCMRGLHGEFMNAVARHPQHLGYPRWIDFSPSLY